MSQSTLTGETLQLNEIRRPLSRSQAIVLGIFNGADELTYLQVQKRLRYRIEKGDIQEVGPRLRELVKLVRLEKFVDRDGMTRFRIPRRIRP